MSDISFIFLYGPPGSGKTTLCASMTKLGLHVEFVDIDAKVDKMVNLKPLLDKSLIKAIPLKAKLVEGTLKQRVTMLKTTPANKKTLLQMPKGFLEFCDIIDLYEKGMYAGKKRKGWVLVVDSLTRLQEHMKRFILFIDDKNKFTFDQWDIWKTNLEEIVHRLMGLVSYFDHVIVIAHEMAEYDEEGAIVAYRPKIDGSMRYNFGSYFEEQYYCTYRNGKFVVQTRPSAKREARTSRNLPEYADSDFSVLFSSKKLPALLAGKKGGTSEEPAKDSEA